MAEIKLPKLPNRTPVKLTISVSPELKKTLDSYASYYAASYSEEEAVADLIPYMLASFLDSDRGFVRARQDGRSDR